MYDLGIKENVYNSEMAEEKLYIYIVCIVYTYNAHIQSAVE